MELCKHSRVYASLRIKVNHVFKNKNADPFFSIAARLVESNSGSAFWIVQSDRPPEQNGSFTTITFNFSLATIISINQRLTNCKCIFDPYVTTTYVTILHHHEKSGPGARNQRWLRCERKEKAELCPAKIQCRGT